MRFVDYGRTELKVSRLGLGCMRFPTNEHDAIEIVRYAIDHEINYIDTAYVYQNSEMIVGKALQNGYRNRANLVTKSPIWNITKHADFKKYLEEQLLRMKTDYFDVCLSHNLGFDNWEKVKKYDGLSFMDKMDQIQLKKTTDSTIFEFCGIEVIEHLLFGSIPSSTDEECEQYLSEIKSIIKENR